MGKRASHLLHSMLSKMVKVLMNVMNVRLKLGNRRTEQRWERDREEEEIKSVGREMF